MGTDGPLMAYVASRSVAGGDGDREEGAIACWAEAVLVEAARRSDPGHPVARSIRIVGVRGDADLPGKEEESAPARAIFDPEDTWTGDESVLAPLFSWRSWDALKDHLVDHGFGDTQVDEQVDPVTSHGAASQASPAAVASYVATDLDPPLREAICGYFASVTDAYLATWHGVGDSPETAQVIYAFPDHVREVHPA